MRASQLMLEKELAKALEVNLTLHIDPHIAYYLSYYLLQCFTSYDASKFHTHTHTYKLLIQNHTSVYSPWGTSTPSLQFDIAAWCSMSRSNKLWYLLWSSYWLWCSWLWCSYTTTILLYYYTTILLYYYTTILLYYYTTMLLY